MSSRDNIFGVRWILFVFIFVHCTTLGLISFIILSYFLLKILDFQCKGSRRHWAIGAIGGRCGADGPRYTFYCSGLYIFGHFVYFYYLINTDGRPSLSHYCFLLINKRIRAIPTFFTQLKFLSFFNIHYLYILLYLQSLNATLIL